MKEQLKQFLLHLPDYPDQIANMPIDLNITGGIAGVIIIIAVLFALILISTMIPGLWS